jgi:hypothetical protein
MKKSVNNNNIILNKNNNKKNTFNVTDSINNLLTKTVNKKKIVNKTKTLINNKSIQKKVIVNSKKSVSARRVNIQKGGNNVITESVSLINTMKSLGNSIFKEIRDITRIGNDINNVASSDPIPNNNIETTTFQAPNLKNIPTR